MGKMSSPKEWDVKMSDINLTAAVRQNLLSLQGTASMMAKTQNKLSTGNKVNSALDNPSNFFTASSLNSRASDLGNLMDSMKSGIKTIEAADNGLTSITKTLESMQSTLRQARQDKSFETASYTMAADSSSLTSTSKISFSGGAFGTGAGSVNLLTGSAQSKVATGAAADQLTAIKGELTETKASLTGTTTAFTDYTTLNSKSLDVTFGGKTLKVDFSGLPTTGGTVDDVVDALNDAFAASTDFNGKITASADGGKVKLEAATATDDTITVADNGTAGAAAFLFGTPAQVTSGTVKGSDGKASAFSVNGVEVKLSGADLVNAGATNVAGATMENVVKAINVQLGNAGSKFKAVVGTGTDADKLKIQADSTSAGALKITGEGAKTLFGATSATDGVSGTDDTTVNLVKTVDDLVNEINNNSTLSTKIKASNDGGKLRIQNLSTQDLNIDGISSSGLIDDVSQGQAKIGGNTVRSDLANQFNELRDQLDKLADDASFNGINLLRGDKLTITFNETDTSSIAILAKDGKSVDSTNLGVPTTVEAKDLDSDTTIDGILSKVKTALNSVRSQSSAFGSNLSVVENRQNFTTSMMNTLQTGAGNLTLADMNEEAANMVALQTRQSLATSSLSMANSADQNVLQLLR
ncbi:hypothetical protein CJ014_01340 [Pleomorphomonas carboxyditropha]|uniref:Flagellin n=2 Tax=Pleomorphomonas TaxID=261933 RepID=A0A2G9X1C7_9HYPH|nr:hypothetical protein CJ014_01340 [Pleomorphomonas carboxyditropha]